MMTMSTEDEVQTTQVLGEFPVAVEPKMGEKYNDPGPLGPQLIDKSLGKLCLRFLAVAVPGIRSSKWIRQTEDSDPQAIGTVYQRGGLESAER